MKKLIAALLIAVMFILPLSGCFGSSTPRVTMLNVKPWSNSNGYEKITYALEKRHVNKDAGETNLGEKEASGEVSYELFEIPSNIKNSPLYDTLKTYEYFSEHFTSNDALVTTPGAYSVLFMDFSLTYESGPYSGKTDKMNSVVLFRSNSLAPVYSERSVINQSNNISYKAIADYAEKKNYFFGSDGDVETNIEGAYDNELLPYVIRARSALSSGMQDSISVNNAVQSGVYNDSKERLMVMNAPSTYYVSGIDPDKTGFVKDYFEPGSVDYYENETRRDDLGYVFEKGYAFKTYGVPLGLSQTNSGGSYMLYYSQQNFSCLGQLTSSVLMMFTSYEYDIKTGELSYVYNYKISDYKTSELL